MRRCFALVLTACLIHCCLSPFAAHADSAADGDQAAGSLGLDPRTLAGIRPLVEEAIASGETSGCVVCIGRRDGIAWLECFGDRQVEPVREPMTRDTVFDLASLTKPVATATSVMQLVDDSLLQLNDTVAQHLPAFAAHGKEAITVRDLLTHTSGLIADNPLADYEHGPAEAWDRICRLAPLADRGERFIYSDVNFIVLGRLVEALRDGSLADVAAERIFMPLGMTDAGFTPDAARRARAAATEQRNGQWLRGEVHDPDLNRISITVSEVRATGDLRIATAYILPLGGEGREEALAALRRNKGELKHIVSQALALKFAPDLRFELDDTFDRMDATKRLFDDERVRRDLAQSDDQEE